jgi:hypothetical protein
MSNRTGNGYITASYGGVSTITDTINVYYNSTLQSGYNRLNKYLGLDVPFEPESASVAFMEKEIIDEYAPLTGFKQVSPVVDFKGSLPVTHAQNLTVVITLDSLLFLSENVDTSKIRLFAFNPITNMWDVAPSSKPNGSRVIRTSTKTLYTFVVGVDTMPVVVVNTSDSMEERSEGEEFIIRGLVRDNISKPAAVIFYRQGGSAAFDSAVVSDSTFSINVNLGVAGLEYFIRGYDQTNYSFNSRTSVKMVATNKKSLSQVPANEWRLVSVPMALKKDGVVRRFSSLGRYLYDWRSYAWENSNFVEIGNDPAATINAGKAYWIRTAKTPFYVTVDTATLTAINKCFEIILPPNEWVVISNPYNFKISWSSVLDSTDGDTLLAGPYGYSEGSWVPPVSVRTLQPWAGYYVKNRGSAPLTLKIPSIEYKGALTKELVELVVDSNNFALEVELNSAKGRNFRHFFGVQSGLTTSKYDCMYDAPSPPSAPDVTTSLSFLRTIGNGSQQKLMTDFSSLVNGGETWQVKLSGLEQGVVYSTAINGVNTLSDALNVAVVDRKRGVKLDMKKSTSVAVTVDANESDKNLEILVGSAEYIEEKTRNLKELPNRYELAQNYPNPFNPATIINYAVPELAKGREMVTLSIYDARGKLVRTLLSEKKESGYYSVSWDGMNNRNVSVSAGVYMYRIKIGSTYVKTLKMVLTK